MRANQLLKHNIDTILKIRGLNRKDLAQWCYRTESWISKIYRNANREIPLKYLDRIADFLGVATYQLFQPGISPLTERRRAINRRTVAERRIGHAQRELRTVAATVDATHPRRSTGVVGGAHEAARVPEGLPEAIRTFVADTERRLDLLLAQAHAGRQTPRSRGSVTKARRRHRVAGGSDSEET